MLDRDTKSRIMKKANELSDICVKDGSEYAARYKELYDSEEFNCGECFLISRLVDLYTAVKEGVVTKDDGKIRQKQLFDTIEIVE